MLLIEVSLGKPVRRGAARGRGSCGRGGRR